MHLVTVEHVEGATIVHVAGEVDAYVAPELEEAFGRTDTPLVVADLTRVSFLDSTALGVVVRAAQSSNGDGHTLRVVLPVGTARRIFEITTLDRVLPIVASVAEALDEIA